MRNALLGSIAVWLAGANLLCAQPGHLALQPATTETPPAATTDKGAGDAAAKPEAGAPSSITPDGDGSPLPWMPDWANDLFGASYGQLTGSLEYLLWFNKNIPSLPPLVVADRVQPENGTIQLTGQNLASIDFQLFSGGRLSLGYFAGDCQTCGVETTWMTLFRRSLRLRIDSASFLGRSFFNTFTNTDDAFVVGFPNVASGTVNVVASSQTWGAELNAWKNVVNEPITEQFRFDVLVGFRYLDLNEDLSITSATHFNPNLGNVNPNLAGLASNVVTAADLFGTDNQFFGGQVGFSSKFYGALGTLDLRAKLAIGDNHESLNTRGAQVRTLANGASFSSVGGVLVQRSNLGFFTHDQFIVVPELNANWILAFTKNIDINLGYSFIFMSRVLRPGANIDPAVDPSQIPNFTGARGAPSDPTRPGVPFLQNNYYAHGLSFGVLFHW
jgi:hypothetical protein